MMKTTLALAALMAIAFASPSYADDREELLKLKEEMLKLREEQIKIRDTSANLIETLVQRGILDKKQALDVVKAAEDKAAQSAAVAASAVGTGAAAEAGPGAKNKPQSIRVARVPEFVKEEIRNQVRAELKDDVVKEVKAQAKQEKWGIPAALPEWVSRIHPFLDNRLRVQNEFYQPDNAIAFNWPQINQEGGVSQALAKGNAFLNTRIDRLRLRERFRIGFDADMTNSLKVGFRLATSNQFNPVSNNQTLGNYGESYQIAIDRVFFQYDFKDKTGNDWLTLWGGRIPNPWMSTDVVFDPDLSFEGIAGTFRFNLNRDDPVVKSYHPPEPNSRFGIQMGPHYPDSFFATAGIFPIQEINFSSSDKWLYGGQLGADWLVYQESRLQFAASYYHYDNISARRNSLDSQLYDWTAPEFMQKGNSLVAINDAQNQTACNTGALGAQNVCLVGLASGFEVFNATALFDYASFAPTHIMLTADFAKNLGFNQARIKQQFGDTITPRTNAWQVRLDVGRTSLRHFKDWSLYFAYRYLERDAVLDAFTDSVFHQGGTDTKGWVAAARYGLANNTWMDLRWLSADAIDGPPFSIDTLLLELNARF